MASTTLKEYDPMPLVRELMLEKVRTLQRESIKDTIVEDRKDELESVFKGAATSMFALGLLNLLKSKPQDKPLIDSFLLEGEEY